MIRLNQTLQNDNDNDNDNDNYNDNDSDNQYNDYQNDENENEYEYDTNGFNNEDDEEYNYNRSSLISPYYRGKILEITDISPISYNQELNDLRKKFNNKIIEKQISHCLLKKQMSIEIDANQQMIDTLNLNKNEKLNIINTITNRIKIRKDEIDIAESNKNLLVLDKTNDKTKNKKIIEINNLIGRIQSSLESSNNDLINLQKEVSDYDSKIISISKMNEIIDNKIKIMIKSFPKEMRKFTKKIDIDYNEFAMSRGWTILTIRNKYARDAENKSDTDDDDNPAEIIHNIEVISPDLTSSPSPSPLLSASSSPPFSFSTPTSSSTQSIFKIDKMKEPIRPTLPEPVKREIVPVVVKSNYGMKPCNYGNICISKNCKFLHASGHTHEVGRRNKETLEREENIRFQNECQEYNACWDKYEAEMREWNAFQKLHSTDEFPALGGGARK